MHIHLSDDALECKRSIFEHLKAEFPTVTWVCDDVVVKPDKARKLCQLRPDIGGRIQGQRVAIEIQASSLTLPRLLKRSLSYSQRNVSILWIVPLLEELGPLPFRPRLFERYLHSMYFGRTYYWYPGLDSKVQPVHYGVAYRHIPSREWYADGEEQQAGGYDMPFKRIRKLETRGPDDKVVDEANDLTMTETPVNSGVFESSPLALVADSVDDTSTPNEEAATDVTHLGVLGGRIVIKMADLNAQSIIPIKKESHTLNIDFIMIPPPAGTSITVNHPDPGVEPVTLDQATDYSSFFDQQEKHCRELYAQLGVNVTTKRHLVGAPTGAIKAAIESGSYNPETLLSEVVATYGHLKAKDHVMVIMVPAYFSGSLKMAAGYAPALNVATRGWCHVSLPWLKKASGKSSTSAHEVGHILGLQHVALAGIGTSKVRLDCEFMKDSGGAGIHGVARSDGKRFNWLDVVALQKSPHPRASAYLHPVKP